MPSISKIEPSIVPLEGTLVTIHGSGFFKFKTVRVLVDDTVILPSYVGSNTIAFNTPPGTAGTYIV